MELDDLENFKNWWLETRPFNTPQTNVLSHVADTYGVVLYRKKPYQVELFNVKPNSEIPAHIHPNVDSYEVFICGDINFMRDGSWQEGKILGDTIRVYPHTWHGGKFGERGGCFLSIQKWLNDVEPKFVGDDWVAKDGGISYGDNMETKKVQQAITWLREQDKHIKKLEKFTAVPILTKKQDI